MDSGLGWLSFRILSVVNRAIVSNLWSSFKENLKAKKLKKPSMDSEKPIKNVSWKNLKPILVKNS